MYKISILPTDIKVLPIDKAQTKDSNIQWQNFKLNQILYAESGDGSGLINFKVVAIDHTTKDAFLVPVKA